MITIQNAIDIYCEDLSGQKIKKFVQELMDMNFNPEVHYPMVYLNIHYCNLEDAEKLLSKSNLNDSTYWHLYDYLESMKEAYNSNYGVFPLSVSYRKWWDGPHLDFPKELHGIKFSKWYPARIEYIDNGIVEIIVAKKINEEIQYGSFSFSEKIFDYGSPTEGDIIELAYYNNFVLIKKHVDIWEMPEELKKLNEVVTPVFESTENKISEWKKSFYN